MSDDKGGLVSRKIVNSLLYFLFGNCVECACSLVEYDYVGVAYERTRYGQSLTLTSGKVCAVFFKGSIDAERKSAYKIREQSRVKNVL